MILKRIIYTHWFKSFFSSTLLLFLLLTVANLISGFLRGSVSATDVLMNYIIESPGFLLKIFPVSCLTASLFSINKLKSHNELTAIFASGFSTKDYLSVLLQSSLIISMFQFFVGGFLQPYIKSKKDVLIKNSQSKFRNLKAKGLKTSTLGTGKIWFKNNDYFYSFKNFDKNKKQLIDLSYFQFDEDFRLIKKVTTKFASFSNDIWLAPEATVTLIKSNQNFHEIKEKNNYEFSINEDISDFLKIESDITTLNIVSLFLYLRQLNESGINTNEYLILFLDKISSSLICIILTMVAAIGIYNPNRRNSSFGKNITFVFALMLTYWLSYDYALELGKSSKLNPYIASFSLPFLFLLFFIIQFNLNKKLK